MLTLDQASPICLTFDPIDSISLFSISSYCEHSIATFYLHDYASCPGPSPSLIHAFRYEIVRCVIVGMYHALTTMEAAVLCCFREHLPSPAALVDTIHSSPGSIAFVELSGAVSKDMCDVRTHLPTRFAECVVHVGILKACDDCPWTCVSERQ